MWKDIPGWGDIYEVNENGDVRNKKTHHLLAGDTNNCGYLRVQLYREPERQRFFRHRLVASLFLENPDGLVEVNHIDGDKQNNHVDNLEWCDRTHNEHEARRNKLKEYRPFYVILQDGTRKEFEFYSDFAREIGVTRRCVANYLQGISNGYKDKGIQEIQYLQ